jgi:hypothetical protein
MGRVTKYCLLAGVTALFAVSWGLLLRQNLMRPRSGPPPIPDLEPRDEDWGIYLGTFRIGESHLLVVREEDGSTTVTTDAEIDLGPAAEFVFGMTGKLDARFRAGISPLRGLQSFHAQSEALDVRLDGLVSGDEMLLRGVLAGDPIRESVPFDQRRILGDALSPMVALPELDESRVGEIWSFDMLNPVTGTVQDVTVQTVRTIEVDLADGKTTVFELQFSTGPNKWTSWVTDEGRALVQGTPFGLTLQRSDLPADVASRLHVSGGAEPATSP